MKPADITLSQLGGTRRLSAMIGAQHFLSDDEGSTLTFQFKGSRKANYVRITLNAFDLYDIEFQKIGRATKANGYKFSLDTTGVFENIGVESLIDAFEEFTGLYLTLISTG